jgi:AAA+ ATPase superfamily predicted ATPase
MTSPVSFYHREQEIADLDHLTRRDGPAMVLVYGRRRVGKTALLSHWTARSGMPTFYWTAPRTTPDNLRTELVRELWHWESPDKEIETAPRYDNWLDVFRALRRVVGQRKINVVLDEFPWAVESEPSLPSRLQAAWDHLFADSQVRLFISGSHISAMESLLRSDAPLFGRMTGKLYVPPFQFTEIAPFTRRYSLEKRLAVYATIGGIPDYLRRWNDRADLMTNIREFFLSDLSPFRNEAEILISDVLRRDSPDYEAVLAAIARGAHELGDIATATLIAKDRAASVLATLVELRLVERRLRASVPVSRHERARYARYHLADPFLRFYYRMVEPNRSFLAQQNYDAILRHFTEQMRAFTASAFEELCRTWTLAQGRVGGLGFAPEFVGSDWHGGEMQADVVAVNWRESQVLIGEAKWGEKAVDHSVYTALKERAQKVLARMENKREWTVQLALFARRGFTSAVIDAAKADRTRLLTFEKIVSDLEKMERRVIR